MIRELFKEAGVRQGFTAEYSCDRRKPSQGLKLVGSPDTGVDPKIQIRERLVQLLQHSSLNGVALDSIEIGNIEMGEGMQAEQPPHHIKRFTAATQDALQWLVGFTVAAAGMDGLAAGEIDNRNQVHR